MAIVGYEAIVVVAILLVVFLWGPQKLPELARSIGLAKKEFEKVAKETSSITSSITTPTPASTHEPVDDPLIVAARSLGISTEGKTKQEIAQAIAAKTDKPQVSP